MKPLFAFLFVLTFYQAQSQTSRALNTWEDHLPYTNAQHVAQSPDRMFVATSVSMYFVQKSDFYMERMSKCTGLSDIGFRAVEYDAARDRVLIAYDNSNIDLWSPSGVINIPDIKLKNIIGDKTIYSVYIDGDFAYLAMGIGIVVLDLVKLEVKDTYYIGAGGGVLKVNSIAHAFNRIYAATADGLYSADANSPTLNDFNVWSRMDTAAGLPHSPSAHVMFDGNHLFATFHDSIFSFDGSSWSLIYSHPNFSINNIKRFNDLLYVCEHDFVNGPAQLTLLDANTFAVNTIFPTSDYVGDPRDVEVDESGRMWLADLYRSLSHYENGSWNFVYPNGPASNSVWQIEARDGNIYVAPGALDANQFTYNRDGFFIYRNGEWKQFSGNQFPEMRDTLFDIIGTTYNPLTGKSYYAVFGGGGVNGGPHIGGGLIEEDNGNITIYKHGYVMKDPAFNNYPVYDVATDANGNVWATNPTTAKPLIVKTPDNQWASFALQGASSTYGINDVYPDQNNRIWVVARNEGLIVFDPGADVISNADDSQVRVVATEGQGSLPSNAVLSMAQDHNGEMWIGTDKGIAVMYCAASVMEGCEAQKIIVSGSDSIAGYLLETERVTAIVVDPGNRKWIGTDNGVWLFSANGLEQVQHFTIDNSPLFSNSILDLSIDQSTGILYIATSKGLQSFQSDAVEALNQEKRCEAVVYPNPVKHEYAGAIAMSNLPYNGTVKITDAAGAMIYQTTANGALATWNGFDYKGRRAASGVYYVTAVSQDGKSSCRAKFVVLN